MWHMPIPDKWTKRPELGTCSREESVFVFGFAMAQGLIEAVVFKKSPGSQERNRKQKKHVNLPVTPLYQYAVAHILDAFPTHDPPEDVEGVISLLTFY